MSNNKSESSSYQFTRAWFDFAFENQGKVSGNHTAMYLWLVELNNRMGWAAQFGAPRDQTMAAAGISSPNTYKKVFNDLVEWGFVYVVKESKNQWTANVVALSKIDGALYTALDKARYRHVTEHDTGTMHGTVNINKPLNPKTKKQVNIETIPDEAEAIIEVDADDYAFEDFWNDFDKKVGDKSKIKKKWEKLRKSERLLIKQHLPQYIAAQPNKQYRKNPETYINNKSWNDEIILRHEPAAQQKPTASFEQKQSGVRDLAAKSAEFLRQFGTSND
ncbi:hypothetical protein [Pedobacter sp. SYP-B3415]|uniref:hypothetical protein n=1 Tax=Pedobacter sp. SYP-B3415 TaxID=2496641 RepID=UPI00101BCC98|nr:hypothetical protein [Pedobacter sp. SYP-B3415]